MTYSTPLEGKIDQTVEKVPGFVGQITTGFNSARNVHVKGSYAYVTSNGDQSVKVIDISDPTTPVEVGDHSLSPSENPTGIFIAGHYAYVVTESGNRSLFILDISDPTTPVKMSDLDVGINSLKKVIVSGKYAYITGEGLSSGGLVIVDISDPANPFVSGTLNSSSEDKVDNAFGIDVIGKYAYIACSNDQLTIVDVSDPTTPVVAGAGAASVTDSTELNEARGIEVRGKYAYIACRSGNRLSVFDVSDPEAAPVFVTSTTTIDGASDVSVVGKYAYVAAEDTNGNFARVDISLPLPSGTGNLPLSGTFSGTIVGARGLYVEGNYAYIAALDGNDAFTVVDISGAFLPSLETGSLKTDLLTVTSHSEFTAGVSMGSGLNVSRGIVAQEGITADSIILSGPFQSSIIASGSATEATDYTLPTAYPGSNGYSLTATTAGVMSWTNVSGGGGSGDVVGPSSATDNAIVRFDTTTGKLVQDSLVSISDTGAIILSDSDQSHSVTIKANDTTTENQTLVLPAAYGTGGSNYVLTDASGDGNLTWAAGGGGATVSGPNNAIQFTTDSSTLSGDAAFTISGSNLTISDSHYLVFGDSTDFQITHFDPNTLFYNNNATGDTIFRLGDTAGATEFKIRDDGNTDFFHIDSSATMKLTGKITKKSEFTDATKLNNVSYLITRGAYSYMTTVNNDSFVIMDIRRPDAMSISSIVGELVDATNLDGAGRFAIKGNHAFILKNSTVDEIAVVDITDPSSPTYVDSFSTSGMNGLNDIKIKGNVAYISTSSNERFYSIDISDPSNLVFLDYVDSADNANLVDPQSSVIVGDYAYVVCHGSGGQALVTVDISDPKVMSVTSSLVHNGSTIFFEEMRDIVSNGQYLFAITFNSPSYVSAIDISTASAPTYVSRITPSGLRWGQSLVISGKYLYTLSDDSSSGEIFKIDITNPASMTLIEDINEANLSSPKTIDVQGNYLHVGTALDYYMTFYIGGTELSSSELGSTTSSSLSVTGDSYVGQDSYVDGTLHVKNGITSSVPFYLPSYVVASLPSASPQGGMIFVSDASGGAVTAFSDGTNWRRTTDRAIVS